MRPDSHTQLSNNCLGPYFVLYFLCVAGDIAFPRILCTFAALSLYREYVVRTPPAPGWCLFTLWPWAGFMTSAYLRIQSFNKNMYFIWRLATILSFPDSPPPSTKVFPCCLLNSAYWLSTPKKTFLHGGQTEKAWQRRIPSPPRALLVRRK